MGFQKPNAPVKPTLACLGSLSTLEDAYESQNGVYTVMPYEIAGRYGSYNTKGNLVFLPEWFSPGFNPLTLDKKSENVYRMNLVGPDDRSMAALEGLAGSRETFEALGEAKESLAEFTNESISEFLQEFFSNHQSVEIGYVLKQKTEKLGDGTRIRTPFYEIGSWYFPTEESIGKLIERARKSEEKPSEKSAPFKLGFDLKAAGIVITA